MILQLFGLNNTASIKKKKKKDSNKNIMLKSKPARGKKTHLQQRLKVDMGPCCHIWTRQVEQCSPETFCCICPNLTAAHFLFFFPDIQCCAHMSALAPCLEHRTGKSNSPHRVVRAHLAAAPWVSLAYITCMEYCTIWRASIADRIIFETEDRSTTKS